MDREFVFAAVADERRRLATLLESLDETQLATPSLCAGWDVKTVFAHLVSDFTDGFWGFQRAAIRRGSVHRGIDDLARRRAEQPATDIARTLREHADHRLSPPVTGSRSGLTDVLAHGGDIRIPLGLPFDPDPQLVALTLDFLTGPSPFGFVPRSRLHGITLHANDIDRTWGRRPEVHGSAAALMMTVLGRDALVHQLDGPGLPILRRRLAG
ncbi:MULTISPECIES: maleylpyruvate isomerase family mycothiol-dependent enzyme [unclassified Mycobacterium]|uniref:maleylpyruvate isomerase family mycothiol-dependent enzyme n=1 Tax=unclassified Mycobacterium TaxID=2642494 RepID=UPI0029C67F87|nr:MULTISPECIES: maleylpyruvate isomerase family mycothiol-dependent enzyme [unclassified Mycobacterium]